MIAASTSVAEDVVRRDDDTPAQGRAAAATFVVLGTVYVFTSAPDITWWDAGEFVAAARTLGIPHPPGTPLYILLANVWSTLLGVLGAAHAVNLLSAVCTAAAGAIAAQLLARATGNVAVGVGAGICAGTMATVWASATEAEVYAPALLLAMLMLWSAERAGRTGEPRFVVLTAYLFALAAPLHVTALVAGPAAIILAATREDGGMRSRVIAGTLILALLAAGAIGTGRWVLAAVTGMAMVAGAFVVPLARRTLPAIAVAISAFAFLLVRAQHDPGINQGNPATLGALLDVIAREQYTIAGFWPRQAPVWLQVVNFLEYADWQVALGFGPTVTPTVLRTTTSVAYVALGAAGCLWHRRIDRRSWRALAALGLCGSIGVLAYLNLKAGPSIGYGILPDDAPHEPRERDYFFALAFWTWGLWAGLGAIALARRRIVRRRAVLATGFVLAGLPALLNWRAMDRRREPEASLPRGFAEALLREAPPRAVLLTAGDNDSYPLWYLQHVEGVRRDVVVVTYPLLGAGWYRDELHRRAGLGTPPPHEGWMGMNRELAAIASTAVRAGRPLAAAVTVERSIRERIAGTWKLTGLIYVAVTDTVGGTTPAPGGAGNSVVLDWPAIEAAARRHVPLLRGEVRPAIDPTPRLMREVLSCPSIALRARTDSAAARLLESTCNSR